ncbi:hypothetical protein [Methanococcoides burtonii]|uniref:Uncharacterized protein n=1 Tax=Methanococcoides burtonii (strain DSM 6242 / NBRC 107633 / OCM 468 / ACE-M) TaxID=259564 RepID=Q12YD9_METBU|nr:hypothetical protein [Methanococcoides burtonii]ABE51537.1 Hypothetical protein Mbur_0562 [Methanococcoides burtonii DSM 6242]
MTLKQFSKDYRNYGDWLKAQPRTSEYAKRVIRFHERFPTLSLNDLRNTRLKDHNLSTTSWKLLNSQQKRDRTLSLEILRNVRKGVPFSKAIEKTGANKKNVINNLGKYLYKSKGKWRVTASDRIESEMAFNDRDKGLISIVTTRSKDRSLIAEYFNAVNQALKSGDSKFLKKFENAKVIDAEGNEHYFVTDLDRLYEIQDAQEEPEFFELYV